MRNKSAEKIKLTSYDDLFGTEEQEIGERITMVPIHLFHPFKDHPFRVLDDEKMQETVESVRQYGVLMPGIVRPSADGYEVVAGHRRWRACELAGLTEMPVIIREMDDDTATVLMVDTNIQREDILPSEKARAYRMKYEAMKHQGSKGDKAEAQSSPLYRHCRSGEKSKKRRTRRNKGIWNNRAAARKEKWHYEAGPSSVRPLPVKRPSGKPIDPFPPL